MRLVREYRGQSDQLGQLELSLGDASINKVGVKLSSEVVASSPRCILAMREHEPARKVGHHGTDGQQDAGGRRGRRLPACFSIYVEIPRESISDSCRIEACLRPSNIVGQLGQRYCPCCDEAYSHPPKLASCMQP